MFISLSNHRHPRFLEMLPKAERRKLLAGAIDRSLSGGAAVFQQGDESRNLFVIRRGVVKIYHSYAGGETQTVSYYGDGMLVGAHGSTEWAELPHVWSAETLGDCKVTWLPRRDFLDLIELSSAAARALLAVTEHKAALLRRLIRVLAAPSLENRVGLALEYLGALYPIARGEEIEIDARFTHQEIAELVRATRQSVTMALTALEKQGRIRREGKKIFVRDERALHTA